MRWYTKIDTSIQWLYYRFTYQNIGAREVLMWHSLSHSMTTSVIDCNGCMHYIVKSTNKYGMTRYLLNTPARIRTARRARWMIKSAPRSEKTKHREKKASGADARRDVTRRPLLFRHLLNARGQPKSKCALYMISRSRAKAAPLLCKFSPRVARAKSS